MSKPLLSVSELQVSFRQNGRDVQAVQSISFTLNRSQTMAIVGESGSGKSVTALAIMGLVSQQHAVVRGREMLFHDKQGGQVNLLQLNDREWTRIRGAQISMIFQEPMTSLNPLMRCGQQVAEAVMLHKRCSRKQAVDIVLNLFREVRLPDPEDMINRYPHEISGGQKQRVMIAMAIACEPLLLIADEPTTALDVTVQRTIVELLLDLCRKRGMSVLFITHDLNLVRNFADQVLIMYRGNTIETGETKTVFEHPAHEYTLGLMNCRPSKDIRHRYLPTMDDMLRGEAPEANQPGIITSDDFKQQLDRLTSSPALISLHDLEISYEKGHSVIRRNTARTVAVNKVSLAIRKGETLGLVGESGCGKTSIGKAIAGLIRPSGGAILFNGKDIHSFSASEWMDYHRNVQIIFQDPYSSLNPRLSIGKAIREPMDVHGILPPHQRDERVIELLQKVGLNPEHYHRYPHEFSGGQRQRICIARSLGLQPVCIVCDESLSALDVSVQAQVLNLLVSLKEEFKLSYLFISHNLAVVRHISDYVAVMQHGQLMEYNDAETLNRHPAHPYTRELIASDY